MKHLTLVLTLFILSTGFLTSQEQGFEPDNNDKVKALLLSKLKDQDNTNANACFNPNKRYILFNTILRMANHPEQIETYINDIFIGAHLIVKKDGKIIYTSTQTTPANTTAKLSISEKSCRSCSKSLLEYKTKHIFLIDQILGETRWTCRELNNEFEFIIELSILGYNTNSQGTTTEVTIQPNCSSILPHECFIKNSEFLIDELEFTCESCH